MNEKIDRKELARLWHRRAQTKREQIFAETDSRLRPTSMVSQVEVAVPGMVGQKYAVGGLAIVSVNPAGGKDNYIADIRDLALYAASAVMRLSSDVANFERMNAAYTSAMPCWGAQWIVIRSILSASGLNLDQVAYPYLVPYRSRDDAGSKLPRTVFDRAYSFGFTETIAALRSKYLIPVDRPSEEACLKLPRSSSERHIVYLTRKRDAHEARKQTLERLRLLIQERGFG